MSTSGNPLYRPVRWPMLLAAVASILLLAVAVLQPAYRYSALLFFVIGIVGMVRQYRQWLAGRARIQ